MKIITHNYFETQQQGAKLAGMLKGGEVLCLYGDLGAGKTTFLHGLINFYIPHKRVLSPTFIIVRRYEIRKDRIKYLYHADLYRLENVKEIADLGLSQNMNNKDTIVAIEWAQNLRELLPKRRIDIYFEMKDEDQRFITVQKYG
jgi:tRNA threonylcarbamoyladenosine biosynthesis protein TsaE